MIACQAQHHQNLRSRIRNDQPCGLCKVAQAEHHVEHNGVSNKPVGWGQRRETSTNNLTRRKKKKVRKHSRLGPCNVIAVVLISQVQTKNGRKQFLEQRRRSKCSGRGGRKVDSQITRSSVRYACHRRLHTHQFEWNTCTNKNDGIIVPLGEHTHTDSSVTLSAQKSAPLQAMLCNFQTKTDENAHQHTCAKCRSVPNP